MADKEKTIYDLKLHEKLRLNCDRLVATRVPGGWIYEAYEGDSLDTSISVSNSICFVPFNDEFTEESK